MHATMYGFIMHCHPCLFGHANHVHRIMLIDLYERPYSPEAPKSRAFIDRILALSGPDGGVVGGEDGVSTQRPLKDGGREAWDMIRRLRQKAWQKAGLNPRMLWTEKDQIYAGVTSPADPRADNSSPYSDLSPEPPAGSAAGHHSSAHSNQPHDFNKRFYNITRSHTFSNPANPSSTKSPLRYQSQPQDKPLAPTLSDSQFDLNPESGRIPDLYPGSSSPNLSSFGVQPPTQSATSVHIPPTQPPVPVIDASASIPFMDTSSPNPLAMVVPTPPSMVDPNINFDWDQWDAVFGQHLPVADDLMELDPVAGLDFSNIATAPNNAGNNSLGVDLTGVYPNGLPKSSPSEMNFGSSTGDWPGYY